MVCLRFALFNGDDDIENVLCACGCNAQERTPAEQEERFRFPKFIYKYQPQSAFASFLRRTAEPTFDNFPLYQEHMETKDRLKHAFASVSNDQGIPSEYSDYADWGGDDEEVKAAVLKKLISEAEDWDVEHKMWNLDLLFDFCLGWSPLASDC